MIRGGIRVFIFPLNPKFLRNSRKTSAVSLVLEKKLGHGLWGVELARFRALGLKSDHMGMSQNLESLVWAPPN